MAYIAVGVRYEEERDCDDVHSSTSILLNGDGNSSNNEDEYSHVYFTTSAIEEYDLDDLDVLLPADVDHHDCLPVTRKAGALEILSPFCRSTAVRLLSRILTTMAGLSALFLLVIYVGAETERNAVVAAPSTISVYTTSNVCGMDGRSSTDNFETFESVIVAHADKKSVVHCGDCGQCSTLQDIQIMADTKATLTKDATSCALLVYFGGREATSACMDEKVGFTTPCKDCWVDNILCTMKKCSFTCLKSVLLKGERNNHPESGELNSCLECDERMCGPAFIQCAGANRRRLGIVSDIGRSNREECSVLDFDWESERVDDILQEDVDGF